MDTNNPQFQKAYTDLVSAFIQFMNVVNPGSASNNNAVLHLIASQLNQVLEIVKSQPGVAQDNVEPFAGAAQQPQYQAPQNQYNPYNQQPQYQAPQNQYNQYPQQPQYQAPQNPYNQQPQYQAPQNSNPYNQQPQYQAPQNPYDQQAQYQAPQNPYEQQGQFQAPTQQQASAPTVNLGGDVKVMYSQYPESFKGKLVFKGASLREGTDDNPLRENGAAYLYKLNLDYANRVGTIEIVPHVTSADIKALELVSHNPMGYMPNAICEFPNGIPDKISKLSSSSKLNLRLDGRSWAIADGEKFVIELA